MQEFTAVSSSTASGLADALNAHAADGWELVQVVNAGHELAAILVREAAAPIVVDSAVAPVAEPEIAPMVETAPVADDTFGLGAAAATAAVAEPAGWGAAPESATTTPEPVTETAAAPSLPASQPIPEPVAAAVPAVPSGWYADPSGRFELRYWDGGQWTEHVSRAGQQYTDPPVA